LIFIAGKVRGFLYGFGGVMIIFKKTIYNKRDVQYKAPPFLQMQEGSGIGKFNKFAASGRFLRYKKV